MKTVQLALAAAPLITVNAWSGVTADTAVGEVWPVHERQLLHLLVKSSKRI